MSTVFNAHTPIGPYNEAVESGGTIYIGGQIGINWDTKQMVAGGIGPETHKTMQNIAEVVEASGGTMGDIVKTTCFLADIADYSVFNAAYSEHFPDGNYPARETVGGVQMVKGARVEVSAIARRPGVERQ